MVYARDGQWERAERSFLRSIELNANRSTTYTNYAYWLLAVLGRIEEALQQLRLAEKADPLSPEVHTLQAAVLISAGRYEEAVEHGQKLPAGHRFKNPSLARARLGQGRIAEAVVLLTEDPSLLTNPQTRGFLGHVYARSGRRAEAEKMANASHYANEQALIFAGLGDKDRTLEALDRMAALGAQRVGLYLNYPELALLRGDPRLKVFHKQVGLPE